MRRERLRRVCVNLRHSLRRVLMLMFFPTCLISDLIIDWPSFSKYDLTTVFLPMQIPVKVIAAINVDVMNFPIS